MQFEVAYARQVANCEHAEKRIHDILKKVRINDYREFFRVSLFQAKEVFEEVCLQVDLECNDAQEVSRKTVIDQIGTRKGGEATFNSNERLDHVIAQEITRIRRENDFKKTAVPPQTVPAAQATRKEQWDPFGCFLVVLALGVLFLLMKFAALPIAGAIVRSVGGGFGDLLGGMILLMFPVIYFGLLSEICGRRKK